ncbi:MAG: DNA repair ATPase [Deltaproteobacteria bacterium]|nr:DNA repair ATPase [Deltaproteobacteria bacterium]
MAASEQPPAAIGDGYEVIRARLVEQAGTLGRIAEALNQARKQAFGSTELVLASTHRARTENNCVPADIVTVGNDLLFGYNVFLGLKTETTVADVFSVHRFEPVEGELDLVPVASNDASAALIREPRFASDFAELYKYYKHARLTKLSRTDTKLLAVFRMGPNATDLRVFRWGVGRDGVPSYIDNRGERDFVFPPQHTFEWVEVTRDQHVSGTHPHANILNTLFVETVSGTLTVKVENNTEDGEGIYSEPVDDPRQALDDADIFYAKVGTLVLLKVLPFNEKAFRYLVFATRSQKVVRIDAIGHSCVELPEDHGVIFPGGYYLQDGQHKVFEGDFSDLEFERSVRAPNGEDVLYVFHRRHDGLYILLVYNLIEKRVSTPIRCHGYSLFEDGRMMVFRAESQEPTRVHPMQVWTTPFLSDEAAARAPKVTGPLGKIGNAALVRGISDALTVRRLVQDTQPTRRIYEDLIAHVGRTMDLHHWLGDAQLLSDGSHLLAPLQAIRHTAELVVDEFEKVQALQAQAQKQFSEAQEQQEALFKTLRPDTWTTVAPFMEALGKLRAQRGHLIGLKEVRYIQVQGVEALEAASVQAFERVSGAAVGFLLKDDAFTPVLAEINQLVDQVASVEKTRALAPLAEKAEALNAGLNVLSEVVGGLKVEDPTVRTNILERISEAFGQWGRLRATVEARRKTLLKGEGEAEFAAQFKLFGQSVSSAVGMAETPQACDEQLSRLMVQMEELESRFSEFDEYLTVLAGKREEVYEALNQKKQRLLDERQRRAANLMSAAERILQGVGRRAQTLKSVDELNGYFAADPMILKVRELAVRLVELGEGTRADELGSKVKSAQQEALRGLKDKLDLYEDGDNVIRLGKHKFTVNTQPLDLTLVPQAEGEAMALAVTGTDYREAVTDTAFAATRPYWSQTLASETSDVYRGEYLAASMLFAAEAGQGNLSVAALQEARLSPGGLQEHVRKAAASRYDEGYERGVHDADATAILEKLLDLRQAAGLLRFSPQARALATLFWAEGVEASALDKWHRQAGSLARLRALLGPTRAHEELAQELQTAVATFAAKLPDRGATDVAPAAARYLIEELAATQPRFVCSHEAFSIREAFAAHLDRSGQRLAFEEDLRSLQDDLAARLAVARAWIDAFVARPNPGDQDAHATHFAPEVAALLLTERTLDRGTSTARTMTEVTGLLGNHPRIENGTLRLRLDEFLPRLQRFVSERVPGFADYKQQRQALLARERTRLRLDEFKPRVLTSFVRNRLVNEVYLPLVGDNLAKQMGAAGEKKRTDLMGLLLVISPPGYGKTTLMEYVASRLGLVFMKVNGPSLGHEVRSLDPEEAPNATARQEVEKINLALEMGNNVMLYLDDIQHTHPELLQKFISLCDAQRRIEGVWKGRTRTYDMRGKRFCVVMAGNPYTESGDRFQIPDMLANRADTYNLGDILSGKDDVFALSYIENAITSNPVLAPLATRDQADIYKLIRMAQGEVLATTDLSHGYAAVELADIKAVLERLMVVQKTLLRVNQQYIASASTDDKFRTEPPFKLQGSYRNMSKLAEKVVGAMTPEELDRLIEDHYVGEAQTLTTGAETNLLKLAELRGTLSPTQAKRWNDIKHEFVRVKKLGGAEDDPVTRVTGQLSDLGGQLQGIRSALEKPRATTTATEKKDGDGLPHWLADHLGRLDAILHAMEKRPVNLTVQTEAPRGVEEALGQQVAIVERTLIPLVRAAARSLEDRRALEQKIEQLLAALRQPDDVR